MNTAIEIGIEGIGVWSKELPNWSAGRHALCGEVQTVANSSARPAPDLLAPNERRRAQEGVLLAVEVGQQACTMAGRDPRELPNIFVSAHGDMTISDYLCATLARAPLDMSPTKFHNSVHNAPAGYWSIATGCMASSTALSAGAASFGAGLLEATVMADSESCPVLMVAYDIAASGPLTDVVTCRAAFAVALVLAPPSSRSIARLLMQTAHAVTELAPEAHVLHASYHGNPAALSLPLLTALARREQQLLTLPAGPTLNLHMEILI